MKLSEMREILSRSEIQLTKSLGQNFLHDQNQLRRIIDLADLHPCEKVLEIGPGLGPLTELLLASGAEVLAIEKDRRLVKILRERFSSHPKLRLREDDALAYLQEKPRDWGEFKLVSNLPYSVASPILVELALSNKPPQSMIATLQLEVAQRLIAQVGSEHFGQLSLFIQLSFIPGDIFKIPAGSFFPPPDVDSACVALKRRPEPLLSQECHPNFLRIVKRAFSERRKMMLKLLKNDWPAEKLAQAFAALNIKPDARAETVSLDQFVGLTKILSHEQ